MSTFEFKILNTGGKFETGRINAESASQVAEILRGQGSRVIYIKEAQGIIRGRGKEEGFHLPGLSRISIRDLSIFTNQFGTMLNAGLPIARALSVLKRQTTNQKLVGIIGQVEDEVKKGNALSQGLAKFPNVFSPLYISMVQAGETSGNLGNSLITMSNFLQRDYVTRNKIKGAMTYPIAVLIFAVVIVIALFIFVIPTFEGFLMQLGAPLPVITKAVFAIANFLIHWGWIILLLIIAAVTLYLRYVKTPAGRRSSEAGKLKMPIFGELNRKSAMARFSDTLSTLFSAGIPIVDCLSTIRGVIDNVIISEGIDHIIDDIKKGESLSAALERSGLFTSMVVEMTAIGEESGSLDKMLSKAAEFYNEEVDHIVNNVTALINPILMVFVGGLIAVVLIALYLPVFQMAGYIQ
jgi:type IV pilus assembly protein PilC